MHEHERYIPLSSAADSMEDNPSSIDANDIWLMEALLIRLTNRSDLPGYIKAAEGALEYTRDPLGAGEDDIEVAAMALRDSLLGHLALLVEQANGLLVKRAGLFVVHTSEQLEVATSVSLQEGGLETMAGGHVITMVRSGDWEVDTTLMDETERHDITTHLGWTFGTPDHT